MRGRKIKTHVDPFISKSDPKSFFYHYFHMSRYFSKLTQSKLFEHTVTITIFLSALNAGIDTNPNIDTYYTTSLNNFVQAIFTIDCICKCFAEPYCWYYFQDRWNLFDVVIVLVSYVPLSGGEGLILVLRLLRLLRLLKLMRRFKTLQIIMETLSSSFRSIIMISGYHRY